MILNRKNYFSKEAEAKYLGSSSLKAYDLYNGGCPAKKTAELKGEWRDKPNPEFLLGNYLHSWSSGDIQEFISNTPELFKKDGTLLAKYTLGDIMIEIFKTDPAFVKMREGSKEEIFTGKIGGVYFKIQVDILNAKECRFCDIKTTKSMYERYYNPETKRKDMSFIQHYNYENQFAIYVEILRQNYDKILEESLKTYTEKEMEKFIQLMNDDEYLECFILVVDKQEIPDRNIIFMDINSFIKEKLEEIELKLPRIIDIRNGVVDPERCNSCDYCRSTKKIIKPIHYLDLLGGN